MLNLIKMNVYRFLKSKFMIGLLITAACAAVFAISMSDVEQNKMDAVVMEEMGLESQEDAFGIMITPVMEPDFVVIMEEMFHSRLLVAIISIYAALFSSDERHSGFLKNMILPQKKKGYLFVAKLVPIALFTVLCFGVTLVTSYLVTRNIERGPIAEFIPTVLIQLLLHIAFGAFTLAYMEIFRNQAIGVMLSILSSMGLHAVLVGMLEEALVGMGFPEVILFGKNMIISAISSLSIETPTVFLSCILSAIIGVVVYAWLGSAVFNKRDL